MSDLVLNSPGGRSGFFGKLPARRDFVTAVLPHAFTEPWHNWLEDGLAGCQDRLGAPWLDAYLTMPVWRFALAGGVCGEAAVAGIMIPSLDRVGRHFPLTIAALVSATVTPTELVSGFSGWYRDAEPLALSCLDVGLAFEPFEQQVAGLPVEGLSAGASARTAAAQPAWFSSSQAQGWQFSAGTDGEPMQVFARVFERAAARRLGAYSLWWTIGSERVAPTLAVHSGLPSAAAFTALLDGNWDECGWRNSPDFQVIGA
ncbi:MAG: type VI secretion system-associated protein TagF [Rhodospirillaceae bacterium]